MHDDIVAAWKTDGLDSAPFDKVFSPVLDSATKTLAGDLSKLASKDSEGQKSGGTDVDLGQFIVRALKTVKSFQDDLAKRLDAKVKGLPDNDPAKGAGTDTKLAVAKTDAWSVVSKILRSIQQRRLEAARRR